MIRILRLRNWGCFRGEHELVLNENVYAIVASHSDNPDRSNWSGKSSLLESMRFVLYGTHRHRTEDAWITHGESDGFVELVTDGGIIRRVRARGKRTELDFNDSKQDRAQEAIESLLGMTELDFIATCYFEQRRMARFILEDPASRMKTVRTWTRIDKLEECYANVRDKLSRHRTELDALRSRCASIEEELELLRTNFDGDSEESVTSKIESLKVELGRYSDGAQQAREQERLAAMSDGLCAVVQQGKLLASEISAYGDDTEVIAEADARKVKCEVEYLSASEELSRFTRSSRNFDGKCPVTYGTCPVKDEVTAICRANSHARDALTARVETARIKNDDAKSVLSRLWVKRQNHEQNKVKLEGLRAKRDELVKLGVKTRPDVIEKSSTYWRSLEFEVSDKIRELEATRMLMQRYQRESVLKEKEIQQLSDREKVICSEIIVAEAALQVFGKNGAQRRAAESILSEIESGANESIRECGIDLSTRLLWSKEGEGHARECERCGSPFPTSAKAKTCARCSAERGANLIHKLDVELSNRSGAAEDIAGISIQLAASAWLRRTRSIQWSTAMIDEPVGQLDAANRKMLTSHLAAMLSGRYGYRQSFIVAHSPDVSYALPGRIEIRWEGDKPCLKVVE